MADKLYELFHNPNAKYVLAASGKNYEHVILTDIDRFANRDEAEAEAWQLADEAKHGTICLYIATAIEDGKFVGEHALLAFYPIPSERLIIRLFIRRIVGDYAVNLCECKSVTEARAEARRIVEQDRAMGIGGVIEIIGYHFKNGQPTGGSYRYGF